MGKVLVILMLVLGVWIGLEVFTKGTDEAFGGLFASGDAAASREASGVPQASPAQRIGARVQKSMNAGAARSTGGVDEPASDEAGADDGSDSEE